MGGVMRGTDIAKALAMGADAMGVRKAIETLHVELERAMGLLGTRTVEELKARGPELIKKRQTSEWPPKDYVVPKSKRTRARARLLSRRPPKAPAPRHKFWRPLPPARPFWPISRGGLREPRRSIFRVKQKDIGFFAFKNSLKKKKKKKKK